MNEHAGWYDRLQSQTLGCVMLDIIPTSRAAGPPLGPAGTLALPQEWAAPPETLPPHTGGRAIPGRNDEHHLTVKYGLVPGIVTALEVRELLTTIVLPEFAEVEGVAALGKDGNCITLVLKDTDHGTAAFAEVNETLSTLPHVDTWPSYVPHVSLGYVQPSAVEAAIELAMRAVGKAVYFARRETGTTYPSISGLDGEDVP